MTDVDSPIAPYPNKPRDWLLVSEVFTTIQGEGPSAGQRALFIRLGACNQHCLWCDTPYTWVFDDRHVNYHAKSLAPFNPQEELKRVTLIELCNTILDSGCRLIVITGGEPMLQSETLARLISAVNEYVLPHRFEIETAGTISPAVLVPFVNVKFNVSPKLANSGNPLELRRNIPVLSQLAALSSAFKFVTDGKRKADVDEIEEIIQQVGIPKHRVWLMPLGTDSDEVVLGMQRLAPIVMEHGWNLTSRLHVLIWEDERGR
jgi:7-carboxy-7-deazaguanine synthase